MNPEKDSVARRNRGRIEESRPELTWTTDDEEALQILKLGGTLSIVFLLIYAAVDFSTNRMAEPEQLYHWALLAGSCLFFGLTWTEAFRRRWKVWTLTFCAFLMTMFVALSATTRDPESRFIAIILCPLATASFVNWGPRWQFAMGAACLVIYWFAERFVPIRTQFHVYRWVGLLAALAFGQCTAIFLERYRRRIRGQVNAIEEAARFRETQIATMAHDIRSPVSALAGYAQLLEDDEADPEERRDLLARIGSTAWNMNLVVSNVLDLYRMEESGNFRPSTVEIDPNRVISEVSDDCAIQARRKGVALRAAIAPVPPGMFDPHHLDRIVRNLLAFAIGRVARGEVTLRTGLLDERLKIEVAATCPMIPPKELERLVSRPDENGNAAASRGIGLYLSRAMAEAAGGKLQVQSDRARGLMLLVELPLHSGGDAAERDR